MGLIIDRGFIVMLFSFLCALYASQVAGDKKFHLGRSRNGNLGIPSSLNNQVLPKEKWFEQKLDHFKPTNQRTWKQRYYVNESFYNYNKPGPVFLMIGGEGPASAEWMVNGAWIDYAKKFKAFCFQLEHRFYGESHPTENLDTKHLMYLSSHQALSDLATFISGMNEKYKFKSDVKWIVFGGSYPGSLAAWARLKYPHLIYAAVSSSGPLLAKLNFKEYYKMVVNALREKTGGELCVDQLIEAHEEITYFMKTDPQVIEREYKLCQPLSKASPMDIKNLYDSLAGNLADLVQYNEDNRISTAEKYRNITINTVCNMMTEVKPIPAYKRFAAFNSIMLDKANETCLDYNYNNLINELRNVSWTSTAGGRAWTYQTCTEFGFYQTSTGEAKIFGNEFDINFFIQQCEDIFGKKFNTKFIQSAIDWTNSDYGALDIDVSRVVFVHGSIDPWHALGVTSTLNTDAPAIYIKGTAHCANMYPASPKDSAQLVTARRTIKEYLEKFINMP